MGAAGTGQRLQAGGKVIRLVPALLVAIVLATLQVRAESSQFKGLEAISRELSTRIAPKDKPLDLDQFLPSASMDELLGTWSTFGAEHDFRNGVPNGLNLMIWQVTLARFAQEVGQSCTTPRLALHPRFIATLRRLCAWPATDAKDDGVLLDFWTSLMGYDATPNEFVAWRDFFLRDYRDRPAAETVAAMTLAVAMNPRFLLHR